MLFVRLRIFSMNKNRMECKFCLWRAITVAMCVLVLLCTLAYFVFFDRCQTVKLKSGAVVCLRDRWIRYKGIGQFGRAEIRNPDKMSASELWQVATRYCLFEYGKLLSVACGCKPSRM